MTLLVTDITEAQLRWTVFQAALAGAGDTWAVARQEWRRRLSVARRPSHMPVNVQPVPVLWKCPDCETAFNCNYCNPRGTGA